VETPRKFITAKFIKLYIIIIIFINLEFAKFITILLLFIYLRGVSTNRTIYILSPCKHTKNLTRKNFSSVEMLSLI
jgi:hypothetical protein